MEGFLQKLRAVFEERIGFTHGAMVVAVSGGLDSMVLLHALAELRRKFEWELVVAHAHHGLRGSDGDRDEAIVETAAGDFGLPFVKARLEVRTAAQMSGESLEMAARRLRHSFLAETAASTKATRVALAHHADDQAELLLLRILRGTGSEGLAGMTCSSPSPVNAEITLLRPLLDFTRADLAAFASKHRIRFNDDASNRDLSIPRNRVRHHLVPLLEEHYNPALSQALRRLAEISGAEADFLRIEAARWKRAKKPKSFNSLHVALQRTILRQELWEQGIDADFQTIERRRKALLAVKAGGKKRSNAHKGRSLPETAVHRLELSGRGGTISAGALLFRWKIRQHPLPFGAGIEQFDADSVGGSLILRHRRPGDRFQPLGMARPGRLQNIFINRRVPFADRDSQWVFERSSGGIVWVQGLPPAEDCKVTPKSRRILMLELVRSVRE